MSIELLVQILGGLTGIGIAYAMHKIAERPYERSTAEARLKFEAEMEEAVTFEETKEISAWATVAVTSLLTAPAATRHATNKSLLPQSAMFIKLPIVVSSQLSLKIKFMSLLLFAFVLILLLLLMHVYVSK
jgi:hypothetical protein